MLKPLRADKSPSNGKVIHFTKARRYPYGARPMIEPPVKPFGIDTFGAGEKSRLAMAEADIRADMTSGDLDLHVLRKINFALDALKDFRDAGIRMQGITYLIEDVRNYGEPEGLGVLKQCYVLYGKCEGVLEQLFHAADNIGTLRGMRTILTAYVAEPVEGHLSGLDNFAWWFPGAVPMMVSILSAFRLPKPISEEAVSRIQRHVSPESSAAGGSADF